MSSPVSRSGYSRALPASAKLGVLSPSGTCGSFPASAKPLALPLIKGSGSTQLRQRRFRALAPGGQSSRKTECQVVSFIRQGQYTRPCCALQRWCRVAFKSTLGGSPSSALTIPSSGQSKGYALRLPLMSNVGRHKELVCESPASCHCAEAVKASGSMPVCIGCAARRSNAYASRQAGAAPLFFAIANVLGYSPKQATHASRSHRAKAFRAQLVAALARRRR